MEPIACHVANNGRISMSAIGVVGLLEMIEKSNYFLSIYEGPPLCMYTCTTVRTNRTDCEPLSTG
jgi:hypothetical protein